MNYAESMEKAKDLYVKGENFHSDNLITAKFLYHHVERILKDVLGKKIVSLKESAIKADMEYLLAKVYLALGDVEVAEHGHATSESDKLFKSAKDYLESVLAVRLLNKSFPSQVANARHELGRDHQALGEDNHAVAEYKEAYLIRKKFESDSKKIDESFHAMCAFLGKNSTQKSCLRPSQNHEDARMAKLMSQPCNSIYDGISLEKLYEYQSLFYETFSAVLNGVHNDGKFITWLMHFVPTLSRGSSSDVVSSQVIEDGVKSLLKNFNNCFKDYENKEEAIKDIAKEITYRMRNQILHFTSVRDDAMKRLKDLILDMMNGEKFTSENLTIDNIINNLENRICNPVRNGDDLGNKDDYKAVMTELLEVKDRRYSAKFISVYLKEKIPVNVDKLIQKEFLSDMTYRIQTIAEFLERYGVHIRMSAINNDLEHIRARSTQSISRESVQALTQRSQRGNHVAAVDVNDQQYAPPAKMRRVAHL